MAKHIIEVRCSRAALCAFDPKALPEGFDDYKPVDVLRTLEDLQIEHRFRHLETDEEGDYICHVYVNELAQIDQTIASRIYHQSEFQPIDCPSGRLWFCGVEFVASEPLKGNELTPAGGLTAPRSGKSIRLKHGTHQMRITRIDNFHHHNHINWPWDWRLIGQVAGTAMLAIFALFALGSAVGLVASVLNWASISIFGADNCNCMVTIQQAERRIEEMVLFLVMSGAMGYATHLGLSALPKPRSPKESREREKKTRLQTPDFVFEIFQAKSLPQCEAPKTILPHGLSADRGLASLEPAPNPR